MRWEARRPRTQLQSAGQAWLVRRKAAPAKEVSSKLLTVMVKLFGTVDTECTRAQDEYDRKVRDGTLGHLEERARCDANGLYEPLVCIPGEL